MANKIFLIGNVGGEPTFTVLKESGTTIAKFSIAVPRSRDRKVSDWFNCVVFGALAEKVIKPFVHKGSSLCVIGQMEQSTFKDKDGNEKKFWQVNVQEVQLLGSKGGSVISEKVESTTNEDSPF